MVLPCKVGDTVYLVSAVGCGDNVYFCDKPCNGTWENCNSYESKIDEIPFSYFRIYGQNRLSHSGRSRGSAEKRGSNDLPTQRRDIDSDLLQFCPEAKGL